jgi:hypothetical protein
MSLYTLLHVTAWLVGIAAMCHYTYMLIKSLKK